MNDQGSIHEPIRGAHYPPVVLNAARFDEHGMEWSPEIAPFFEEPKDACKARFDTVITNLRVYLSDSPRCRIPSFTCLETY